MEKLKDIYKLFKSLPKSEKLNVQKIGNSTLGLDVYAVFINNRKPKRILVEGGIHAREWITCFLIFKLIEQALENDFDADFCFVPIVNPDGVGLALEGLNFDLLTSMQKQKLLKINKNSLDFSLWKANINGVDCNVNFNAWWGKGKNNVKKVASANYIGKKPNSEIEVKNMIELLNNFKPHLTLSYHSKGEVIFYGFDALNEKELARDEYFANRLSAITGYQPVKTVESVGGFSDYVSLTMRVPAFTIEVGCDEHPHPIKKHNLETIFKQNYFVLQACIDLLNEYEEKNSWKNWPCNLYLVCMFEFENKYLSQNKKLIAGMDEAGRGPLAGPVVCACVVMPLDENSIIEGVSDSKKLNEKTRNELYEKIIKTAIDYSVVFIDHKKIDEINILNATKLGMKTCVENLKTPVDVVLIDAVKLDLIYPSESIIKGDELSYSIACASILAKVERDRFMQAISSDYPEYLFYKHKGYPTKEHIELLKQYGACDIHRQSFLKNII